MLGFMRLLWAVAHGLESTSKRMGTELGVTGPQRLVLRLIGHYSRLSPGDLAQLLHVHPSSLTGVLGRLEQSKLLARRRDPSDGRRAILSLTAKGRALNARRVKWTPSFRPKAGWRKRDACSGFAIIKNTS